MTDDERWIMMLMVSMMITRRVGPNPEIDLRPPGSRCASEPAPTPRRYLDTYLVRVRVKMSGCDMVEKGQPSYAGVISLRHSGDGELA